MQDVFDLPNNTTPSYKDIEAEIFSAYSPSQHADIVLSPKGDGALISGQYPDGSIIGGNPRGSYAIDLQSNRSDLTQVASGFGSIILGLSCTASNTSSIAMGSVANSSGFQSLAIGSNVTSAGDQSIAIGTDGTSSSGFHSIAIGDTAIASGQDTCAIGVGAKATAINAFALGDSAVASVSSSMALGLSATATRLGQLGYSSGSSFTNNGRCQYSMFILQRVVTTTTVTDLTLDGLAPTATNVITIPSGSCMGFISWITGIRSDGNLRTHYTRKGFVQNVAGTTSVVVASVVAMGTDETPGAAVLAISGNDVGDYLQFAVANATGAETWRWTAVVQGIEFNYGT